MELLTVWMLVVLAYGGVASGSNQAEGKASSDMAGGQGMSFYIMGEVFRLKGVVEEMKASQLKRMEEDIEELQGAVQPEQQNNQGELEDLRAEIDVLKKDNKATKEENDEIKAEVEAERTKSLRLETAISKLQKNDMEMETILSRLQTYKNGVTYVRWGRSVCPADSEKVYTGYVGGGHYTHSGSGANWLCLTDEPQYGYHEDNTDTGALVYGGEYEFGDRQKNGGSGFFGKNLNDLDAICVVCRPPRPSIVMIPGRNTCYRGWRMEYSGYLVADYKSHSASNFICLDSRPEPRKGSQSNRDGKTFYMAAGICGSLPCPPYVNGRQLTCVVCSK